MTGIVRDKNPLASKASYEASEFRLCFTDGRSQKTRIDGFVKVAQSISISCVKFNRHLVARDILFDQSLVFLAASCFENDECFIPLLYFVKNKMFSVEDFKDSTTIVENYKVI